MIGGVLNGFEFLGALGAFSLICLVLIILFVLVRCFWRKMIKAVELKSEFDLENAKLIVGKVE